MNFHEWTDDNGEVLILRRIPKNRTTHNDFVWPSGVGTVVECPDWNPAPVCGGGLHGWPLGFGLGDGCDYDIIDDIWLVVGAKPEDVVGEVQGGIKCKCRRCTIRLEGTFGDAMARVQGEFDKCVQAMAASGDDSKAAASGYASTAAASGYYSKAASSGRNTAAAAVGRHGRVRVGEQGAFAIAFWSGSDGYRFLTGKVGENGIKANTWYCVQDGQLQEVNA